MRHCTRPTLYPEPVGRGADSPKFLKLNSEPTKPRHTFSMSRKLLRGDRTRKVEGHALPCVVRDVNTRSSIAPELPFGGIKRSDYGRELSEFGIKELVNQKKVVVAKD